MSSIIRIGMDTAKNVFQLHGVDGAEEVVLKRQFRRAEMVKFFEKLPRRSSPSKHAQAHTIGVGC